MYRRTSSSTLGMLLCSFFVVCSAHSATPVWIDSDPACDMQRVNDVDDCWALVRALQADEISIRGISTVFGNSSESSSYDIVTKLLAHVIEAGSSPPVFRGASSPYTAGDNGGNNSIDALAAALEKETLTIVALGPLTNIAALITKHPDAIDKIERLVVVAGQRPEQGARFHPGSSELFHVHDFNFRKDVTAFQVVLDAALPITLLPYEVASKVQVNEQDLLAMAAKDGQAALLAKLAVPWLNFWQSTFGSDSFYPFDSLAVGYAIDATRFKCEQLPVSIEHNRSLFLTSRDRLLVSESFSGEAQVSYCSDVDPLFKSNLLISLQNRQ